MSTEIVGVADGVLTARIAGMVSPSDVQAMQKSVVELLEKHEKLRLLLDAVGFAGLEKGRWSATSTLSRYDAQIEKMAIIGDRKWENDILLFTGKGLRRAQIEYFAPGDEAKARAWLST
jgi:hypothetical protein